MAKQPPLLLRHILSLDASLSHTLHKLFHPHLPASLLLLLELSADFRLSFPLALALFLSPLPLSLLPFLSPLIFGLLLDLALVGLVKLLFRRPRPPYNPAMSAAVSADHFSFPSGHASRVFFLASLVVLSSGVIRAYLGDDNKVSAVVVAVCVWAAMTAASRVLLGRHYCMDVVAGSCLGVLEGIFAYRFLRFEDFLRTLLYQRIGLGRS
ncbi:hypothetical protein Tsubulata_028364 [Turnera subulata]|uniref:Phosphatidic acid phosphatase type 2/haloperoxidase domain-containing protein n=1 Tax=Turnera subulata TaxID=218843 RepID=A0A9Q0FH93_9ROSI|nr:hypothetical protein Tsubulata_028364 [Turnera subulata]